MVFKKNENVNSKEMYESFIRFFSFFHSIFYTNLFLLTPPFNSDNPKSQNNLLYFFPNLFIATQGF